ncbi:MAG TPA: hypothetical protein PKH33_03250 [bacterium]|nr:hypothetical protein [bacterium]
MRKRLLLLTKSAKRKNDGATYGYCVAGIDEEGKFVRLCADEKGDSLTEEEMPFKPLDTVECDLSGPFPISCQTENFVVKLKNIAKVEAKSVSYVDELYGDKKIGRRSYFGSMRDRVGKKEAEKLGYSLAAIKVRELKIYRDENKKYRAEFQIGKNVAKPVSMTDPDYYFKAKDATVEEPVVFERAILIVSLPNNPPYIKFIAKIFEI